MFYGIAKSGLQQRARSVFPVYQIPVLLSVRNCVNDLVNTDPQVVPAALGDYPQRIPASFGNQSPKIPERSGDSSGIELAKCFIFGDLVRNGILAA